MWQFMNLTQKQKALIQYRLDVCDEMLPLIEDEFNLYENNENIDFVREVFTKRIRKHAKTLMDKLTTNQKLNGLELMMIKDIYYYGSEYFYVVKRNRDELQSWFSSHKYLQIKLEKFLKSKNIEFYHWEDAPGYDVY